jgi:hypothetical protein
MHIDYYPLVSRAASTLTSDTPDARHSLFERIRVMLVNQLRTRQPSASRFQIMRECVALEAAIQQVELELATPTKGLESDQDSSGVQQYRQRLRACFVQAQGALVGQLRSFTLAFVLEALHAAIEDFLQLVPVVRARAALAQAPATRGDRTSGLNQGAGANYSQGKPTAFGEGQTNELTEAARATILRNLQGIHLLDRLMFDAGRPLAPDNVRRDALTVLNWLGIKKAEVIRTEHYAQFACAAHKYIVECQDQSLRLAPATAHSPSALNDNIRSVLNRLLEREQTEKIIDEALTWFSNLWIGLFVGLNVIVVIGLLAAGPTLQSGVAKLADVYSPLNVSTWISQVLALTPALLSIAWKNRRLKRSPAAPKMMFARNVAVANPDAGDVAAPFVA